MPINPSTPPSVYAYITLSYNLVKAWLEMPICPFFITLAFVLLRRMIGHLFMRADFAQMAIFLIWRLIDPSHYSMRMNWFRIGLMGSPPMWEFNLLCIFKLFNFQPVALIVKFDFLTLKNQWDLKVMNLEYLCIAG